MPILCKPDGRCMQYLYRNYQPMFDGVRKLVDSLELTEHARVVKFFKNNLWKIVSRKIELDIDCNPVLPMPRNAIELLDQILTSKGAGPFVDGYFSFEWDAKKAMRALKGPILSGNEEAGEFIVRVLAEHNALMTRLAEESAAAEELYNSSAMVWSRNMISENENGDSTVELDFLGEVLEVPNNPWIFPVIAKAFLDYSMDLSINPILPPNPKDYDDEDDYAYDLKEWESEFEDAREAARRELYYAIKDFDLSDFAVEISRALEDDYPSIYESVEEYNSRREDALFDGELDDDDIPEASVSDVVDHYLVRNPDFFLYYNSDKSISEFDFDWRGIEDLMGVSLEDKVQNSDR